MKGNTFFFFFFGVPVVFIVALDPRWNWNFGSIGFCGVRKTGEPGEKPSKQGREPTTNLTHQKQTQPKYDAGSGNRTRATLVGSERSHHCTIPAPLVFTQKIVMYDEEKTIT